MDLYISILQYLSVWKAFSKIEMCKIELQINIKDEHSSQFDTGNTTFEPQLRKLFLLYPLKLRISLLSSADVEYKKKKWCSIVIIVWISLKM